MCPIPTSPPTHTATSHSPPAEIPCLSIPPLPDSFSQTETAGKPRQLRSCLGNIRTNPSQTRR